MEFWKRRRNYSEEEMDLVRSVIDEMLGENMCLDSLYVAIDEIHQELGRIKLQRIEDVLRDKDWPYVILALPHHCVPNDMSVRTTDDPDKEAKYFATIVEYDPREVSRAGVVESITASAYWENYHRLPDAGTGFKSPGRINTFSKN